MEPSCVRQTSIPGTSKLYGDYLYCFERVSDFYPYNFSDLDRLAETARQLSFPPLQRARIVDALRTQNPGNPALEQLAQPDTVAVVTGQQVGLLSGPAYTIFKALTAVRLAEELCARGIQAVPVFWLATEDHDLAEIDHAWLYNEVLTPSRISVQTNGTQSVPVGNVPVEGFSQSAVRQALGDLPFAPQVLEKIQGHYGPGTTFSRSFHGFVKDVLGSFNLLFLDPLQPAIRQAAAGFLGEVAERVPELRSSLLERNSQLEKAGYHAQVHVDDSASLLFLLKDGKRTALRFRDGKFSNGASSAKERSFSARDLAAAAERLSPNALLRPVMQDYLLPTVAYVAGPAEIAYFAQSQVLYQKLLGRMPLIYPRNSMTLLDARASKLLDRYGLHVEDLLDSQERVRAAIAAKLVPRELRNEISSVRAQLTGSLDELRGKLLNFDSTLAAAAGKSIAKMTYQMDKLSAKTARETMRRDHQAASDTDYLLNLIYPQRHLQERFYSIVPLLAEHGLDLPDRLYGHVQLTCPDHMVRVI